MMIGFRIYRLYSFANSNLNTEGSKGSGITVLAALTFLIDIFLFGWFIVPFLLGLLGIYVDINLSLAIGVLIAAVIEILTRVFERRKTA